MIDGTVAHVWVTRCFAFNFREARVKLCTLKVCIQDVFIFFFNLYTCWNLLLDIACSRCYWGIFLWLPKLRITFFTRGRKVYDSQVIFARETSPSWKGKLYVSFYIRKFACKCIPKWISKKIVVLNIFEQFFRQCQAYFLAHFNFFSMKFKSDFIPQRNPELKLIYEYNIAHVFFLV